MITLLPTSGKWSTTKNKTMTKEEKIKEAWGEHYKVFKDYITENGWVDFKKAYGDRGLMLSFKDTSLEIMDNYDPKFCYWKRPISLNGIEDNNGWITDKKPEENENVLIFCDHMQPKVQHAFWDGKDWRQNMFDFENKVDYKCRIMNVTGWKHLPKPPIY